LEQKLTRLKDLIAKRDDIDAELGQMLGIEKKERKPQACSKCGSTEHTARNCENKLPAVAI
jgi:hypothetical protein